MNQKELLINQAKINGFTGEITDNVFLTDAFVKAFYGETGTSPIHGRKLERWQWHHINIQKDPENVIEYLTRGLQ